MRNLSFESVSQADRVKRVMIKVLKQFFSHLSEVNSEEKRIRWANFMIWVNKVPGFYQVVEYDQVKQAVEFLLSINPDEAELMAQDMLSSKKRAKGI